MKEILLCSHNPLLIKNIIGILIDDGYSVDTVDHPSNAVRNVLKKRYNILIIDSEPFGLSGEDAIHIIRILAPDIPVISLGVPQPGTDATIIKAPIDLEEFKQIFTGINRLQHIN
ncbi:MAG: response regulator [Nitrospirota bacterium]